MQYLMRRDARLAVLIGQVGVVDVCLRRQYFPSLVRAVVGQQLSVHVAERIYHRLEANVTLTPAALRAASDQTLRDSGLSAAKMVYIRELAESVALGDLVLERLTKLPDEQVIEQLTAIKGIGMWTAAMFLIFSLGRLDVMATADAGLRRAIHWLYASDTEYRGQAPDWATMSDRWRPYRTVASLYLWETINQDLVARPREVVLSKLNRTH